MQRTKLVNSCGKLILLALALSVPAFSSATEHAVSLWRVDGHSNTVYLLGSVHLLREQDYPLPPVIYAAYDDAEALVMELDMDDLDPLEVRKLVTELGNIADGRTLKELMGAAPYAQAERLAARSDLRLATLAGTEPWLAAITVEQLSLARLGFEPRFGIETHLTEKAARDRKEITGLETLREQLEILDGISLESQRSMLLQSLEESIAADTIMNELIAAWRYGDAEALEQEMLGALRKEPELYEAIVRKRNLRWTGQLEGLLREQHDYLVVVGVLHLIGDDGVPGMLEKRGFAVEQLQQQATP